jgi:hypothetical protein
VKAFVACGDKDSDTYRDLTGSWTRPPLYSLITVVSGLGGSTGSGRGHNSSIVGTIGSLSFDKMIYSTPDGSEEEEVADRAVWNVLWNEASRELMLHCIVLQNDQSPDWQGAVSSLETGIMLIFEKCIKFSVSSFTIKGHRPASFDERDDLLEWPN